MEVTGKNTKCLGKILRAAGGNPKGVAVCYYETTNLTIWPRLGNCKLKIPAGTSDWLEQLRKLLPQNVSVLRPNWVPLTLVFGGRKAGLEPVLRPYGKHSHQYKKYLEAVGLRCSHLAKHCFRVFVMPPERPGKSDQGELTKVLESEKAFIIIRIWPEAFHVAGTSSAMPPFEMVWTLFQHPHNKLLFAWESRPDRFQLAAIVGLASLRPHERFGQILEIATSLPDSTKSSRDESESADPTELSQTFATLHIEN